MVLVGGILAYYRDFVRLGDGLSGCDFIECLAGGQFFFLERLWRLPTQVRWFYFLIALTALIPEIRFYMYIVLLIGAIMVTFFQLLHSGSHTCHDALE